MAAEDGIAFLYSELARRIRTDVTVRAVITDESLKISVLLFVCARVCLCVFSCGFKG